MAFTVYFNHQSKLMAIKIHDVIANDALPVKIQAMQLSAFDGQPEQDF
jgi:hypothetical protein